MYPVAPRARLRASSALTATVLPDPEAPVTRHDVRAVARVEEVDALERLPGGGVAERHAAAARRAASTAAAGSRRCCDARRAASRRSRSIAERQRGDPRVLDQEAPAVQARVGVGLEVARQARRAAR